MFFRSSLASRIILQTNGLKNFSPTKLAYIQNNSYENSFLAFEKEAEGRMMVQVNENYFNCNLPAYAQQFLVVYWMLNTEKHSTDFASHIEKNFDFKALQDMLDK